MARKDERLKTIIETWKGLATDAEAELKQAQREHAEELAVLREEIASTRAIASGYRDQLVRAGIEPDPPSLPRIVIR